MTPERFPTRAQQLADVQILRVGAPFWGLVLWLAAAWLLEHGDRHR